MDWDTFGAGFLVGAWTCAVAIACLTVMYRARSARCEEPVLPAHVRITGHAFIDSQAGQEWARRHRPDLVHPAP